MCNLVCTGSNNLPDNLFITNDVHNLATRNFTMLFVFFFRRNDHVSNDHNIEVVMVQWFEQSAIAIAEQFITPFKWTTYIVYERVTCFIMFSNAFCSINC